MCGSLIVNGLPETKISRTLQAREADLSHTADKDLGMLVHSSALRPSAMNQGYSRSLSSALLRLQSFRDS